MATSFALRRVFGKGETVDAHAEFREPRAHRVGNVNRAVRFADYRLDLIGDFFARRRGPGPVIFMMKALLPSREVCATIDDSVTEMSTPGTVFRPHAQLFRDFGSGFSFACPYP